MAGKEKAIELLEDSRALQNGGKTEDALQAAKSALTAFKDLSDQPGTAEALRLIVGSQLELLQLLPDAAEKMVKDEAAKVKKSTPDGKVADALMTLAAAEVMLFKDESEKALKAATDAAAVLGKEGEAKREAEAMQMAVSAALMRGNGTKALTLATSALSAAQRAGDRKAEASAWLTVTSARFAANTEDALEAVQKALTLFREIGDKALEVSTLILQSEVHLSRDEPTNALSTAREAITLARELGNTAQVGSALEMIVEALLAENSKDEALSNAQGALSSMPLTGRGAPTVMGAVALAMTACKGVDAAMTEVKKFVVQLREAGNQKGEVKLLLKLASMSPIPEEAMNSAQAALSLAQSIGDGVQETAVKSTLTDLFVAKGKIDKAPTRKTALKALNDLAKALDTKDSDKFDDAAKYLDKFYNALKQDDIDGVMGKVIAKDPEASMQFLQDHGQIIASDQAKPVEGATIKPCPREQMYFAFRVGGLGYGPRYRVNCPSYKAFNQASQTLAVVELQDCSDQWERELLYNPSLLDGTLQSAAAAGHQL